jgi:hypothetical protein
MCMIKHRHVFVMDAPTPCTVEYVGQCDRVVVLAEGRIILDCPSSELGSALQANPELKVPSVISGN